MRLFIHSGSGVVYDFQPGIPYSGNPKASVMQAYMIIRKTTPLISRKPFAFAKVFSELGLTCGEHCVEFCFIMDFSVKA